MRSGVHDGEGHAVVLGRLQDVAQFVDRLRDDHRGLLLPVLAPRPCLLLRVGVDDDDLLPALLSGHGGMDFVMAYRLIECMREGLAPDYDVYDAAAWSAPFPLTEMSVAKGSQPMKFPDFTRGEWSKARA